MLLIKNYINIELNIYKKPKYIFLNSIFFLVGLNYDYNNTKFKLHGIMQNLHYFYITNLKRYIIYIYMPNFIQDL